MAILSVFQSVICHNCSKAPKYSAAVVSKKAYHMVTDVSQTITFPDKTFPGQLRALTRRLFPVQDVSRTIIFPDKRFSDNLYK